MFWPSRFRPVSSDTELLPSCVFLIQRKEIALMLIDNIDGDPKEFYGLVTEEVLKGQIPGVNFEGRELSANQQKQLEFSSPCPQSCTDRGLRVR